MTTTNSNTTQLIRDYQALVKRLNKELYANAGDSEEIDMAVDALNKRAETLLSDKPNNLKQIREELSISADSLCHSQGDRAIIGTRRYQQIESGKRHATKADAKRILHALNINRREHGQEPLELDALGLETD